MNDPIRGIGFVVVCGNVYFLCWSLAVAVPSSERARRPHSETRTGIVRYRAVHVRRAGVPGPGKAPSWAKYMLCAE